MEYRFTKNVLLAKVTELGYVPGKTENKTILVIRDLESAIMYAPENKVVYITDDQDKFNKFLMFTEAGCGNDDIAILMDGFSFKYQKIGEDVVDTGILKTWENIGLILDNIPG